jgi:hypothetical protein
MFINGLDIFCRVCPQNPLNELDQSNLLENFQVLIKEEIETCTAYRKKLIVANVLLLWFGMEIQEFQVFVNKPSQRFAHQEPSPD